MDLLKLHKRPGKPLLLLKRKGKAIEFNKEMKRNLDVHSTVERAPCARNSAPTTPMTKSTRPIAALPNVKSLAMLGHSSNTKQGFVALTKRRSSLCPHLGPAEIISYHLYICTFLWAQTFGRGVGSWTGSGDTQTGEWGAWIIIHASLYTGRI